MAKFHKHDPRNKNREKHKRQYLEGLANSGKKPRKGFKEYHDEQDV